VVVEASPQPLERQTRPYSSALDYLNAFSLMAPISFSDYRHIIKEIKEIYILLD
jgi:hypothetical protein